LRSLMTRSNRDKEKRLDSGDGVMNREWLGPSTDGSRDGLLQKPDILHERSEDFTNSFVRNWP